MTSLRARRESTIRDLDALISRLHGLQPSQWNANTPCKGWEVRHLAAHLVGTVGFMNSELRKIVKPDLATSELQGDPVTEDSPTEEIIASLTVNRNALNATLAEMTEAHLTAETGDKAVFFPPSGDLYLNLATVEAGLHLFDLFSAVDHGAAGLAEEPVLAGNAVYGEAMVKFANMTETKPEAPVAIHLKGRAIDRYLAWTGTEWVTEPVDGVPVTTVRGDDSALVLFACGRITGDDHRLDVSGDPAPLAKFKTWVPGP